MKFLIRRVCDDSVAGILQTYPWLEVCDFAKVGEFPDEYSGKLTKRLYIEGDAEEVMKTIEYIAKTFRHPVILHFGEKNYELEIYDYWRE